MTETIKFHEGLYVDKVAAEVSTRKKWTNSWEKEDHVFCDALAVITAPGISKATLRFEYGDLMQIGENESSQHDRKDLLGAHVRIKIPSAGGDEESQESIPSWAGVIVDEDDVRTANGRGVQIFTAYGEEWWLARHKVMSSFVKKDDEEIEIGRALSFNGPAGRNDHASILARPNATEERGDEIAKLFADDLDAAKPWNATDIAEYLIRYHAPKDADGEKVIDWYWHRSWDANKWNEPIIEPADRTIFELLSALADPRRLATWWAQYAEDDAGMEIRSATFAAAAITLEEERTIPANEDTITIDTTNDNTVRAYTITSTIANKCQSVKVRGAPIGVCWSPEMLSTILEIDWTSEQEEDYISASPTENEDQLDAKDANDRERARHKNQRAWRYYRVSDAWEGETADGDAVIISPDHFDPVLPNEVGEWYTPGLRIENYLPLKAGVEYDGDKIQNGDALDVENESGGRNAERVPPFGFCAKEYEDVAFAESAQDVWYRLDKASSNNAVDFLPFTINVRGQEADLGIVLDTNGRLPHVMANNHFEDATPSSETPVFDYTTLGATVFTLLDDHVIGEHSADEDDNAGEIHVTQWIDAPKMRLDYVAPSTIVDIDNGARVSSNGGFVRDDRAQLKSLARVAYEWYAADRRKVSLVVEKITGQVKLGQLLTSLDETEMNSLVTSVVWDFTNQTTTISTDFADFNPRLFA